MIDIQGGDSSYIKDISKYPKAKLEDSVLAESNGYISQMEALAFGNASVNLGCGRKKVDDKIDYSSSIILNKKPGDKVVKGDLICKITGETEDKVHAAKEMIMKGIKISDKKPEKISKILEIIT